MPDGVVSNEPHHSAFSAAYPADRSDVMDDAALHDALQRHWEIGGTDQDVAHEIYHDDAVLEFLNRVNGLRASRTSRSGGNGIQRI